MSGIQRTASALLFKLPDTTGCRLRFKLVQCSRIKDAAKIPKNAVPGQTYGSIFSIEEEIEGAIELC
jgi:hypothetical protein